MSETLSGPALVDELIRSVPDFPRPGVEFFDIAPVLASSAGLAAAVDALAASCAGPVDAVVGVEARGFIVGAPTAIALGCGFVPVRKPGKLPGPVLSHSYSLEYGQETLAIQRDALRPGARVLLVDDVLATGGTIGATAALVATLGATVTGVSVLLELSFLEGRRRLTEAGLQEVHAVVTR